MFDIGFGEMVVLLAIALVAIGPKQLPVVARTVGRFISEFKKMMGEVTSTVADTRAEANKTLRSIGDEISRSGQSVPVPKANLHEADGPVEAEPTKEQPK